MTFISFITCLGVLDEPRPAVGQILGLFEMMMMVCFKAFSSVWAASVVILKGSPKTKKRKQ